MLAPINSANYYQTPFCLSRVSNVKKLMMCGKLVDCYKYV